MRFYAGYHPMADYVNSMDRDSYEGGGEAGDLSPVGVGIKDVGMSVPMGISAQNVQGIYAKIRSGAGSIEIGFPGAVRGQRQQQTPGMYGEDQRQAIKELGAINDVKFTTHASYGIMGLSGFTGDNPYNVWFQREMRKQAVDEIKRAIEFARDTAGGGSVVVHTGEVDRPISEQPWAKGGKLFKHYEEEPEVARVRVVDERTGQVMQQVRKNVRVARPRWLTAREWNNGPLPNIDIHGNKVKEVKPDDYIDYLGRVIPKEDWFNPETGRVPIYNEESGRFENEMYDWNKMIEEAKRRNEWLAWKKGCTIDQLDPEDKFTADEVYLRSTLETNEGHSRGWALQYGHRTDQYLKQIKKLEKAMKFYGNIENSMPKDELWKVMKRDPDLPGMLQELVPPDRKRPTEMLGDHLKMLKRELEFSRQASASQELQAEDSFETQQHLVNADKYAIREAVKSYAEAGIYAMDNTVNKKNPVMRTMENIFPERYGGHPEELKELIKKSREEMVARLSNKMITDPAGRRWSLEDEKKGLCTQEQIGKLRKIQNPYYRGVSEKEARRRAEEHIKATIDTGHLNIWRKYWQNDPKKTVQQNDAAFKKWMVKEVEDLAKNKMIGNLHLTDNMGYQDDHLAPGQGTTPVNEILKVLRKHGYDKAYTVEPGADASTDVSDFHGLMKSWRYFGSPIYGVGGLGGGGGGQRWGQVQYSYFGQNRPPYYVFGAYAPSNDWTLWSAVPME